MPDPRPLRPNDPREVGGFRLTARIGEGAQGSVFLGESDEGNRVAVKLLHADIGRDARARTLFERELSAARRVAPFCTAPVLAAEADGDTPYIVSEYIEGPSLRELVSERGVLPEPDVTRLAIGTATALAAIHEAGVVHRDLKPANVLLGPDGPKVIDFGIARPLDATSATLTGAVGTPAYMAPEQVAGATGGAPLDMFAWGCTMAFAANGAPPFGGDSIPAIMHRVLNAEPTLGALTGDVRDLVTACLAKDPTTRPTALQVLRLLLGTGLEANLLAKGTTAATLTSPLPNTPLTTHPPAEPPKIPPTAFSPAEPPSTEPPSASAPPVASPHTPPPSAPPPSATEPPSDTSSPAEPPPGASQPTPPPSDPSPAAPPAAEPQSAPPPLNKPSLAEPSSGEPPSAESPPVSYPPAPPPSGPAPATPPLDAGQPSDTPPLNQPPSGAPPPVASPHGASLAAGPPTDTPSGEPPSAELPSSAGSPPGAFQPAPPPSGPSPGAPPLGAGQPSGTPPVNEPTSAASPHGASLAAGPPADTPPSGEPPSGELSSAAPPSGAFPGASSNVPPSGAAGAFGGPPYGGASSGWGASAGSYPAAGGRGGRPILIATAVAAAVVVVAGGIVAALLFRDDGKPDGTPNSGKPVAQSTPTAAGQGCSYPPATSTNVKDVGTPPPQPTATKPYGATIKTNLGTLRLELDAEKAPCAVNSLAYLAGRNFYDDTSCHRLTRDESLKVLQCGDPTGTGSGGPSYKFDNENTTGVSYRRGTVAMANAGPDTNGSQFFILYEDAPNLPASYPVVGRVTTGMGIVDKIADAGVDDGSDDGQPKQKVTITDFSTG